MIKAINSISCKTACGLAKDKVYLLLLAHPYHTVEFSPVFGLCTADALVCKYPHKYLLRIRVDVIGIVFYLYLIAVLLFFLLCAYTAVCSNIKPLELGPTVKYLLLCRDYPYICCRFHCHRSFPFHF